jgi:cysteine desulfurase
MDLMGISISTGSACDGRSNKISHVIEAVKVDDKYAAGTIRISLGKENNISDANMIAEGIIKIISGYGKD